MARVIDILRLGFRGIRFGHLGSLVALIKLEEKEKKRRERLGQEEERRRGVEGAEVGAWEEIKETFRVDSTLEVRILCLFKFVFCVDLRNVMLELGFSWVFVELLN